MKKIRTTLLLILAGGLLASWPAISLPVLADWNSPATIVDGTRVIVSSTSATLILDYRANSDNVILIASGTCTGSLLSLGYSNTVSTATANGSSSKIPVTGEVIYWGAYSGKLYGKSQPGCSTTVDVFRMK